MQFSKITLSLPFVLAMMVSSISAAPIAEEKRESVHLRPGLLPGGHGLYGGFKGGDLHLRSSDVELNPRGAKVDYGYMVAAIIGAFNAIRSRDLQDDVEAQGLEARGLADYGSLISAIINGFNAIRSRDVDDLENRGYADYASLISAIVNGFNAIRSRDFQEVDSVSTHDLERRLSPEAKFAAAAILSAFGIGSIAKNIAHRDVDDSLLDESELSALLNWTKQARSVNNDFDLLR